MPDCKEEGGWDAETGATEDEQGECACCCGDSENYEEGCDVEGEVVAGGCAAGNTCNVVSCEEY